MRETGIGTSLMLIAIGAVLAFAVNLQTTGIDLNTIGVILMVVGLIGLLFSFIALGNLMGGSGGHTTSHVDHGPAESTTVPHEHRRVETKDVVYEDDHGGTTVERQRRVTRA